MNERCKVILRPEVPDDLQGIVDYLAARSPTAAVRFSEAVPRTIEDILRFPGAGSPKEFDEPQLAGIRSWRVRGFKNYLIFYKPIEEGVLILAVLHGARDLPKSLRRRA